MRKNWISVVSLVLNVVLLVSVISLGGKLERTEENLRGWISLVEDEVRESAGAVAGRVEQILEDSAKQVADFTVEPVGMDAERCTLEVNLRLNLRRWSGDTTVTVEVAAGADTFLTALPVDAAGRCGGTLSLPMESGTEIRLTAAITTGGVTAREELGGWWDIAAMLPVQLSSHGGSRPYYENGAVRLDGFSVSLSDGQDQYGIPVQEPEFRLYVNDALTASGPAAVLESDYDGYYVDYEYVLEPVACRPEDTVRLTFVCKDEFGLGYEFALRIWRVPAEDGALEEVPAEIEYRPTLTWE